MANPICPHCQRQMVVPNPQFCPFCGQQFAMQTATPRVDLEANPYAEIPPERHLPKPMSFPMLNRATPTSALVLNRDRGPNFKTTWVRAAGITAGIMVVAVIAVAVLVHNLQYPNLSADQWLSTLITGVTWGSTASDLPTYAFYTPFMQLLITAIPMTAVVAYWFSLRRLYQETAVWVWAKTVLLSVAFLIVSLVFQSALSGSGTMVIGFLQAYSGAFVFICFVAALCAAAGIGFGYFFARWPIERIRALKSTARNDFSLTLLCGLLGMVAQYLLYDLLDGGAAPFANGQWWIPGAALLLAIYACWSALRPVSQPLSQQDR